MQLCSRHDVVLARGNGAHGRRSVGPVHTHDVRQSIIDDAISPADGHGLDDAPASAECQWPRIQQGEAITVALEGVGLDAVDL